MWDLAYNSGSAPYAASVALLPFPGTQDLKQGLELLQKTSKKPGTYRAIVTNRSESSIHAYSSKRSVFSVYFRSFSFGYSNVFEFPINFSHSNIPSNFAAMQNVAQPAAQQAAQSVSHIIM